MPLQGLQRKPAQILGAAAGPGLFGKCRRGFVQDSLGELPGIGGEQASGPLPMQGAEEAVRLRMKTGFARRKSLPALRAAGEVG